MPYAHITGWGMAVPEQILTNADLEGMVETSNEWILERTGIRERRIARKTQTPSVLATEASWKALAVAGLKPADLDLIICATSTPEYLFPATACLVQDNLGATKAGAFDLLAACTGFIYALDMAAQAIRTGSIRAALVIGTENLSKFVDWRDRNTCILFGDGAGVFVLQASDQPGGVLSSILRSDGSGGSLLSLPAGGSGKPASVDTIKNGLHFIHMEGKEVFRFATRVMAQATRDAVEKAGLELSDVQWIIPHQANLRIIDAAARGLKLPLDRFIVDVDKYGNTSTASIPIAVCEATADGRIKAGDTLVLVGFGAGLTWGALTAKWSGALQEKKGQPWLYSFFARIRSAVRRLLRHLEGIIWGRRG